MLAPNLADRALSDFQHWPPWRPWSWRPPASWPLHQGASHRPADGPGPRLPGGDLHRPARGRARRIPRAARCRRERTAPPDREIAGGTVLAAGPPGRVPVAPPWLV